ncbi:amino acid adenylation domain protein [Streptococcus oralis]|nr:amino acid adenylation domain protein [Streptococcus oralis]
MVGLFINTIPIRIKTDPNLSVSQLLKYQQRKNYLVNGNEMISLSEINNLIDQKISSLFSFDVFNDSHPEWMKHEKTFEQTDYTLNLSIIQEEKLYIKMMYDSNKYYESTIIDMLKRFKFILEQFVENENQPLRDIKFSWKEEEKIIEEYSQNIQPSIKVEKNIVSQFKDIANKFMNKVALNFSGETMTYEELDNKSTALALQLRKSGINQGDYVLSLQEKGMEPIISFLAILKINAVYVPLDISVPKERFTYILEDSKAQYILINNTLNDERKRIIKDKSINVISVDKNLLLENKFEYIEYDYPCENLAYIIYTSGTTGKPKGTLISHNGAVNMALGMNLEFEFKNSSEVLLQFASLAFDASILEILTSLLNGHTLVIVPEEKRLNPDSVTQIMNEFKVTWAVLPPVFVNELNPEKLVTLKSLKTAGEEATWEIVDKWKNHLSYANGYGPTEATVWSTTWFENREKLHKKIPIGRPAPNVRCIIFQKEKVCGFGMVGELCISGPGVAIGYLNNETLTNEKFFLFEGEKFYRTGDYARWHYDGNIEFLGRMDKQIKIRGNRVELSEIEDNIKNIASIIDCVVLAKGEGANKELIAYLITADSFDTITLRNRLSSVIPSYMIPSKFIKIKKIPLTANGKIDTPRLLSLTDVKNETENNELSKLITSSTFREVQAVFSEILGINNVKISDDFFVLGGHSIKAARLINRLNSNFSLQIKLEQFFESPTISFILSQIEQSNSQKKPKKQ